MENNTLEGAIARFGEATRKFVASLNEAASQMIKALAPCFEKLAVEAGTPRQRHLAKYAKKKRVRKKWMHALMRKALIIAFMVTMCIPSKAKSDEPYKIRTTCYLPTGNRCANGDYPTEGLTVAFRREDIGKTAILYECNKDGTCGLLIGFFEIEDTGGYYIRTGRRIDVFRNNMANARAWIKRYGDYTYAQIVNSEG